jgi:hypothetical protein
VLADKVVNDPDWLPKSSIEIIFDCTIFSIAYFASNNCPLVAQIFLHLKQLNLLFKCPFIIFAGSWFEVISPSKSTKIYLSLHCLGVL